MKIISAQAQHIDMVTEIFCLAFENSITFFTPVTQKVKNALREIFHLLHRVFGQSFMVALKDNEVYGYIVMADDIKKLWTGALTSGFLRKAIMSSISGEYGLTPSTFYKIVQNKLLYFRFEMTTKPSAQLLSIAVHPNHHSKGIGQKLLAEGIKHMKSLGVKRIKLEARPDNISAVKIYEKHGFHTVGEAKDLQGKWLIMIREER
ncbi:MAG: N-acetyltransferase [Tepidanaerobacteraceae bacterium]|nr:N-acetyltransferase [Tepidanaerobacteraceae bacterium]